MSGNFQVICGSMVGENGQLPVSTETPAQVIIYIFILLGVDGLPG